jgi:hypothetical protein
MQLSNLISTTYEQFRTFFNLFLTYSKLGEFIPYH